MRAVLEAVNGQGSVKVGQLLTNRHRVARKYAEKRGAGVEGGYGAATRQWKGGQRIICVDRKSSITIVLVSRAHEEVGRQASQRNVP